MNHERLCESVHNIEQTRWGKGLLGPSKITTVNCVSRYLQDFPDTEQFCSFATLMLIWDPEDEGGVTYLTIIPGPGPNRKWNLNESRVCSRDPLLEHGCPGPEVT